MQYHTCSLAEAGYDVHVLASPGSTPIAPLLAAPNVSLHYLPHPPPWVAALPTLLSLALKAGLQALLMLWAALVALPRPAAILMQNPPAIPVMAVLWLATLRHRAALVIDWHNLAYSILALKHGRRRWLVALARRYEELLGRRGAAHFCVTEAMRGFLAREFGVGAVVLYDRPPAAFRPLPVDEKHALIERLLPQLRASSLGADVLKSPDAAALPPPAASAAAAASGGSKKLPGLPAAAAEAAAGSSSPVTRSAAARLWQRPQQPDGPPATPFTAAQPDGRIAEAPRRPAIVVSSTSWTPDEDFGILLEAALAYDSAASSAAAPAAASSFPDVLFVITGRGPQRDAYLERISRLELRRCAFASVWLEPEDYPALLGCADLGVCLHTSSSGLDLPMKVGLGVWGTGAVSLLYESSECLLLDHKLSTKAKPLYHSPQPNAIQPGPSRW